MYYALFQQMWCCSVSCVCITFRISKNFSDIKGFCLYKSREDRLVSYLGPIPYSSQAKPVVSRKVLTTNDYHLELYLVITLKFVLFLFWPLSAPPFKAIAPIFLKVPQNFFIWCIFALGGCQLSIYAFRLLCFGGFKITLQLFTFTIISIIISCKILHLLQGGGLGIFGFSSYPMGVGFCNYYLSCPSTRVF